MSREITVIKPLEKVSTAEIMMIKKNIGGLPVISPESRELIGIITQRDIQLSRSVIGTQAFHVDDLYSRDPVKGLMEETFPEIVHKMSKFDVERIPIVDNENRVIGIITNKDIIRTLNKFFQ